MLATVRGVSVTAAFLSLLPGVVSGQARTPAERIASCAACHGEGGNSRAENIPSLAGQPEFFLLNQLVLMRDGVRVIPVMAPVVADLTDGMLGARVHASIAGIVREVTASAIVIESEGEPR